MLIIEGFDKGTGVGSPLGDCRGGTAAAARLIAKFPGKDCRGIFVAINYERNIVFVGGLGFFISKEGSRVSAESGGVGIDTTEVIPIVEKGKDELDIEILSVGDRRVKPRDTWKDN